MSIAFPFFSPISIILVSKFMIHRALSDKTYILLGLLSPLNQSISILRDVSVPWFGLQCVIVMFPDHTQLLLAVTTMLRKCVGLSTVL